MRAQGSANLKATGIRAALIMMVIFVTSGCSSAQSENQSVPPEADQPSQSHTPEEPENPSEPEIETIDCSQVIQSAIETTVNSQTASFAVGDYELAYSYASPSFQASVSIPRFIQIIEGSYGPLIQSSSLGFENCVYYPEPELATMDVRFSEAGVTVYALRYLMVETDLGWRVDGASALSEVGSGV